MREAVYGRKLTLNKIAAGGDAWTSGSGLPGSGPGGTVTLVSTAGAIVQNAPTNAIVALPLAATRVVAAVSRKVAAPAGKVRVRLVIKARAAPGSRCILRTAKKVLQRKACGRTQTVFNITVKRRTVVFVQITGKRQKTVTTRRIRL